MAAMVQTRPYDTADYLVSMADVVDYLEAVMDDFDPRTIRRALDAVVRSEGMSDVDRNGLGARRAIEAALAEPGTPSIEALVAVLSALGLRLTSQRIAA